MRPVDPGRYELRRAFAELAAHASPTGACPVPERIWRAARGELTPAEARPLVGHTAECPACAEAWRLALALEPRAPVTLPEAAQRSGPPSWSWRVLAVAAVVAAVAIAVALGPGGVPVPPSYRAGEPGSIRSLVPEDRPLTRAACVLRWTPGPAGSRYSVRVAKDDLGPVAEATGLESPQLQIPPAALASLPPGARLLWQVETDLPDGGRLSSTTFVARLE